MPHALVSSPRGWLECLVNQTPGAKLFIPWVFTAAGSLPNALEVVSCAMQSASAKMCQVIVLRCFCVFLICVQRLVVLNSGYQQISRRKNKCFIGGMPHHGYTNASGTEVTTSGAVGLVLYGEMMRYVQCWAPT